MSGVGGWDDGRMVWVYLSRFLVKFLGFVELCSSV